jgi:hypothetical protein
MRFSTPMGVKGKFVLAMERKSVPGRMSLSDDSVEHNEHGECKKGIIDI